MKKKTCLCILTVFLSFGIASAEYSLPSSRSVTWQGNVGVDGDIPTGLDVCDTIETSDCVGDCDDEIQAAINACDGTAATPKYVMLGAGTFTANSTMSLKTGVVVAGNGVDSTTIDWSGSNTSVFTMSDSNSITTAGINLTSGYTKGSTQVDTTSAHGLSTGDYVILDEFGDVDGDPPTDSNGGGQLSGRLIGGVRRTHGQIVKVTNVVDSDTFDFEPALAMTFLSDNDPEMYQFDMIEMSGVQDLEIDISNGTTGSGNAASVYSIFSANCWVYNVNIHPVDRVGVWFYLSYRNTLRKTIIHDSRAHTSNTGYLTLLSATTANLIENCVYYNGEAGPIFTGAAAYNVIGYNYITNMWNTDYPNIPAWAVYFHSAFPVMNLVEGNYFDGPWGASGDKSNGAHGYNTWLRNRQKMWVYNVEQTPYTQVFNFGSSEAYYLNFIGNIIGSASWESSYERDDPYTSTKHIYYFESELSSSAIRHENWDSVNNSKLTCVEGDATPPLADCQGGGDDTTLPNSFYLASKPTWFGSLTWPPMDPATPTINDIPAKVYADTGSWPGDAPSGSTSSSIGTGITINGGVTCCQ